MNEDEYRNTHLLLIWFFRENGLNGLLHKYTTLNKTDLIGEQNFTWLCAILFANYNSSLKNRVLLFAFFALIQNL